MDGVLTLVVWDADSAKAQMAMDAASEEVREIDRVADRWRSDSEVFALNQAAGKGSVALSETLVGLLQASLALARETNGWTDVTVGSMVKIWGFDQPLKGEKRELPPNAAIEKGKKGIGYQKILLDPGLRTAALPAGSELDFDLLIRGYALDRAGKILQDYEIQTAKLNLGDQWLFLGASPESTPWKVEIRDPRRPSAPVAWLAVEQGGVAIRTDEEQYFIAEGRRYAKIIDPRTGWPVRGTAAVAVAAPTATEADGWANAMFVAGAEHGTKWMSAQKEQAAVWVSADAAGKDAVRFVETPRAKVSLP